MEVPPSLYVPALTHSLTHFTLLLLLHSQAQSNETKPQWPVTATLKHLLAVFKDEPDPKERAWQYYQAWLIVNNTDFKESPFMSYASARGLFAQEYSGRRQCQKVVAEFWQKERARALSETASTEGWKWEDEQEHA